MQNMHIPAHHLVCRLQEKCRLPVGQAINLLSVCDESGSLPEGQVYFQYHERQADGQLFGNLTLLPPGTRIVISRCPCLSSADLRILTVANPSTLVEPLHRLEDVLVF
jgi:hypothetical protein